MILRINKLFENKLCSVWLSLGLGFGRGKAVRSLLMWRVPELRRGSVQIDLRENEDEEEEEEGL